jgi:hypothetical protein
MPYFIYAVRPFAQLEKLAEFEVYAEASVRAKSLRAQWGSEQGVRIRIMHAADALAAEDLLLQLRQPGPAEDE